MNKKSHWTPEQLTIIRESQRRIQREKIKTPEYQAKIKTYRHVNRTKIADSQKKKNLSLRQKVIEFFGAKCMNPKCLVPNGCSDIRCLQIDHIQMCGQKDRIPIPSLYIHILNNKITAKQEYQLLCANCNWIKRHEKNENKGCIKKSIKNRSIMEFYQMKVKN